MASTTERASTKPTSFVSTKEDPEDYTDVYNTQLTKEEQLKFDEWVLMESFKQKRDVSKDAYDYDLQGLFLEKGGFDPETGHAPDKFKKPNHMTFSDQSKYNDNAEGIKGGKWSVENGKDVFTVSKTCKKKRERLQQYFKQVEPGVELRFEE